MNRKPQGLFVSQAITGFTQNKSAEGLSPRTIASYLHISDQWLEYQKDAVVRVITSQQVGTYLN